MSLTVFLGQYQYRTLNVADKGFFQVDSVAAGGAPFILLRLSSGAASQFFFVDGGNRDTSTDLDLDLYYNIAVSRDAETNIWRFYNDASTLGPLRDFRELSNYTDDGTPANYASGDAVWLNNGFGGSVIDGAPGCFYAWNRALSLRELSQLDRDPFGPFRMADEARVVYALPAVAAVVDVLGPYGQTQPIFEVPEVVGY